MKISNTLLIPAPRPVIWALLHDPEVLRRTIPGCQSFQAQEGGVYAAELSVGVGPIRGRFSGTVTLTDDRDLEAYTMALQGQGPTGFVNGEGLITLTDDEGGTRISIEGDAQIGGTLAQIGSRMLETVVRILMGQFFDAIRDEAKRAAGTEP